MDILIAILIGSIVFLSAILIGMALVMRKQWDPGPSSPSTRSPGSRPRPPRRA